jgi:hypothetical protein
MPIPKQLFTAIAGALSKASMGEVITVSGARIPVGGTSNNLKKASFKTVDGNIFTAIEQNKDKDTQWGEKKREGEDVVQFKDVRANKLVAVVHGGGKTDHPVEVTEYPAPLDVKDLPVIDSKVTDPKVAPQATDTKKIG